MPDKITIGGLYDCDCPHCGKKLTELWDLGDSLVDGNVIDCDYCEKEIVILSVDWDVTIRLGIPPSESKGG